MYGLQIRTFSYPPMLKQLVKEQLSTEAVPVRANSVNDFVAILIAGIKREDRVEIIQIHALSVVGDEVDEELYSNALEL